MVLAEAARIQPAAQGKEAAPGTEDDAEMEESPAQDQELKDKKAALREELSAIEAALPALVTAAAND